MRFYVFSSLAIFFFSSSLYAATVNFETVPGSDQDVLATGQGSSYTEPTNTITLTISGGDAQAVLVKGATWGSSGSVSVGLCDVACNLGSLTTVKLKKQDGSNFSFTSVWIADSGGGGATTGTIEGWKSGARVYGPTAISFSSATTVAPSNWDSLDEVRLISTDFVADIDDFTFGAEILPNNTPSISIDNTILSYIENDAATQIDSSGTLTDSDGDADWNGGTLVVQITANAEAADEISMPDNAVGTINSSGTNLLNGGTTIGTLSASEGTVTNGTALTITFNGNATNALVQQALRAIHYRNTSSTPGTLNRTVTFTATDTNAASANDTRTISVTDIPLAITSATFNASTGALVVTGTGFEAKTGAVNDVDVSTLTFTGEGGATYTLTSATDVEITSATEFTVTLAGTDLTSVKGLLNIDGASADDSTTYNLATADDFMANVTAGDTSDASNGVTVNGVIAPAITSAMYDASTGNLVVTGTHFVNKSGASNDIDISLFTLTGEGGATYTLTSASDVEITSGTAFSVTLSSADKAAVNQIANKNGTSSTGATTYNLAAADNWMQGAAASTNISDTTSNGITVSNVVAPTIASATYDASTGVLAVTGTGLLKLSGATNDIDVTKLTLTGEGSATRILTTGNVEITSGTAFSITLNGSDNAAVNQIVNKNGSSSTGGTTYNLAAAEDWAAGADAAVNVVDATGNGVTASNVATPTITSATYNASTGVLAVAGTGLLKLSGATNDIDVTKLTLTGEGSATRILTTSNVEITSGTAFSITLNGADKAAINQIVNKNGTSSTSGTTYNLAAAEDWAAGADAAVNVVDATGNGITASNVAAPTITSATYDYNANVLAVTGTGLLTKSGASNDIDISKLTFTGEGGATYTITSASDVEITSGTSFSLTLSGADLYNVEALLNGNGTTSATSGATYNLAVAEDWAVGADAAVNVVDAVGNGITVSNYAAPTVTSATYNWSTGQLAITGTNLVNNSGATNDVDVSTLTFTGEGGSYLLTSTADVELSSATAATVTLNAADQLNTHGLLNKNGTASSGSTTYNLAAADNWLTGSPGAVDIVDATGNGITVSNVCTPSITSTAYDSDTGEVSVTGTCLFKKPGANNDVDVSAFTFTGGTGSQTYTLTSATDIDITSSTAFSFTLTGADKTQVDALLDQVGASSSGGSTYNISAADNWLAGADAATDISDATNSVNVAVNPKIISATYNPSTGALVVTGTNIQANGGGSDIDASLFTFTGEASGTYMLTDTADVERDSITQFTLTLSATDKAGVNALLNNTGTSSADATTYNLAAADDWNTNVTSGDSSDTSGNGVTVTNIAPTLTSLSGDSVSFTVAGNAVDLDDGGNATLADLTSPNLDGGNVTVSIIANAQNGEDVLKIGDVGAISTSGNNVVHSDSGGITIGTFAGGSAGTDLVLTLNSDATLSRVRDLLSALQYWNSDGSTINVATRTVRITVDDGDGGSSTSSNQDISVVIVRAPFIDLDGDDSSGGTNGGFNGSFTEDGGVVATADTDNTISDDGTFKSLTVTLTNRPDGASESLSSTYGTGAQVVNTEAVTIAAYNNGTGVLVVSIDDASTDATTLQMLIASIRYNNTSDVPDTTNRSITLSATDNADNAGPNATSTLSVTATNDQPAFTGLDGTPLYTEGGAAVVLDGNVVVVDAELDDADNYNGAVLTLVRNGGANTADQFSESGSLSALTASAVFNLGAGDIGTVTTNSGGALVLTFNGSATSANVDTVLQSIKYSNSSNAPAASVQINWTLSDSNSGAQGSGGALAASGSTTVSITGTNDAPSITGSPATSVTEGMSYSFTPGSDDPDGDSLTFSISNKPVWTSFNSSTGALSGVPLAGNIGVTNGITISVSDGSSSDALPTFSLVVVAGLDTDGDTISDAQEVIDGTNPNDPDDYRDVTAPVLTAPDDITVDAVGLFTPVMQAQLLTAVVIDNVDGESCCNASVPALSDGKLLLPPGHNQVTWRAVDRKGNVSVATQFVDVRPLVSMSKDQVTVEGAQANIRIILNGQAPEYPFMVPYVIDGASTATSSDHDLVNGNVTFNSGEVEASITVNIAVDNVSEGNEKLTIALDDHTSDAQDLSNGFGIYDINSGVNVKHNLTIAEGNVAPVVNLEVQQNGNNAYQITNGGGQVTVIATVTDLNIGDSRSLDWSASDNVLVDSDGNSGDLTMIFDPSNLSIGRYTAVLTATDSQGATGSAYVHMVLVDELPVLSASADTDNDGTNDAAEGTADTDEDGIPDYLDNITALNVLPGSALVTNAFLVECDPGVSCRLGQFSALGLSGGASMNQDDIELQDDLVNDDSYDLHGTIFDFEMHELATPGQEVKVVLPLSVAIPENGVYRKFQNGAWVTFVEDDNNYIHSSQGSEGYCPPPGDASWEPGMTAGHFCLQLTLEDGGPNDADGEVNSAISDPGAVGVLIPVSATSLTTTTSIHSSGGGSIGWAMLVMLLLLGSFKAYAVDWGGMTKKSFIELDVFSAKGFHDSSDFSNDMSNAGVDVDVTGYDVVRTAYQVSLGYAYNSYATFLLSYTDLGDVRVDFDTTTTDEELLGKALSKSYPATGDGVSIAYRYQYSFMRRWSVFADAGVFFWNNDVDLGGASGSPDIDGGTDPMFALGIDYSILRRTTLGLKYRYHQLDDQNLMGLGFLLRVKF